MRAIVTIGRKQQFGCFPLDSQVSAQVEIVERFDGVYPGPHAYVVRPLDRTVWCGDFLAFPEEIQLIGEKK